MPRTPTKRKELTLSFPKIQDVIIIVGDMLGFVNKLRYSDHDVKDTEKFPDLHFKCTWREKERVHHGLPFWNQSSRLQDFITQGS
jgi:hypothetical protein